MRLSLVMSLDDLRIAWAVMILSNGSRVQVRPDAMRMISSHEAWGMISPISCVRSSIISAEG